jgi:hypothetical protein
MAGWMMFLSEGEEAQVEVNYVCESCGDLLATHDHYSFLEVKQCLRGMKALCVECAKWPGCPLPEDGTRGQEEVR